MIVIDTFLFSEPREKEQLLTKLHLGSEIVTEWVLAENAQTFRGEYKGLLAQEMLSDPRFAPFRDRITVIASDTTFPTVDPSDTHGDLVTFPSQYAQRDSVMNHLRERWGGTPDVWVLVSDTDECLDGSTPAKRARLLRWTRPESDILILDRPRFWFDVDNLWQAKRFTPLVRFTALSAWFGPGRSLGTVRGPLIRPWPSAGMTGLMYEYSNCLDRAGVYRKYDTVGHVGMLREDLDLALACNHRPQFRIHNQRVGIQPDDWLKRLQLTERNSPDYVRENFQRLRTGNIADDYVENRKRHYPELFSIGGTVKRTGAALAENVRGVVRSAQYRLQGRRLPRFD